MRFLKRFVLLIFVTSLTFASITWAQEKHYVSFDSPEELQSYLRWIPDCKPLIGAHRGGPMAGFPENCIATFENVLSYAPCLIECDVRKSKDSVLVMMHDKSLERTTTGKGNVLDFTLKGLKKLKLKDNQDSVTPYKIPTLAEVLDWARNKAIVELDIKRGVNPEEVVATIQKKRAENYTIVITYDIKTAVSYHKLNPKLMISASARGIEGVQRLLESGINLKCLLAFVGVYEPPEAVYNLLHKNGIRTILGTMGNLDRKAEKNGFQIYSQIIKNGADILATDNVPLAVKGIEKLVNPIK